MTIEHNSLPDEVQAFARTGAKLFPVKSRSKDPLISDWPNVATGDPATLAAWSQQFPNCNWAMTTGPKSGRFVVDFDGRRGTNSFERWLTLHGMEWTCTQQVTTANGFHLHFRWPSFTITNSAKSVAPGVDVRGWHGYVLIPPSIHPDGPIYEWRTPADQKLLPPPGWLLEEIQKAAGKKSRTAITGTKIPEGERNATLASLAGSMRRKGFTGESIEAALQTQNEAACDPPLAEDEVSTIAESVSRYEPEPRLMLQQRPITATSTAEVHFDTLSELSTLSPAITSWICPPWIPAGGLIEVTGKVKAAGKSTFLFHLARSVVDGTPFLGQTCTQSPVIYLTEQPAASLVPVLRLAGLISQTNFYLLRWHEAMRIEWPEVARQTMVKAQAVKAKLVVVDTLGQFSRLMGDAENSAAVALQVLAPLQEMQQHGIAVAVCRHERKGSGPDSEVADSARGSSAYSGAADVIMRIRRIGVSHPMRRRVESLSRFAETPENILIEFAPGEGYRVCEGETLDDPTGHPQLLAALPPNEDEAVTCEQLVERLKQPRTSVQNALRELLDTGKVQKLGAGVRGLAFKYYLAEAQP